MLLASMLRLLPRLQMWVSSLGLLPGAHNIPHWCNLVPTQRANAMYELCIVIWLLCGRCAMLAVPHDLLAHVQAYSALLHAAVKCGETDLAVDVYGQMKGEGMPRDRAIHVTMIEMFIKLGRVSDALASLGELHAIGEPPDTHLYNLVLVAATKLGPPRFALTVYHRCDSHLSVSCPSNLAFQS